MTPLLIDHVVVLLLVAVLPIWGYLEVRKLAALIHAGQTELRVGFYYKIIAEQWLMAILLLAGWFSLGRDSAAIGLVIHGGTRAWIGYGLTALVIVVLVAQARSIPRNPENLAKVKKQLSSLSYILPHTLKERRTFDGVSVTAGICEEVIFRGYLIAYLMALLGAPFWVAAILSSLAFGLAHSYQGLAGIPRTAAAGGLMALLYSLTGALWAPMVVHAVMDMTSGRIAYAAFGRSTPEPPAVIQTGGEAVGELGS
jgi:membrane protease YdiL (CAAX protease family)